MKRLLYVISDVFLFGSASMIFNISDALFTHSPDSISIIQDSIFGLLLSIGIQKTSTNVFNIVN
ncbi:MAG: hypothetical protein WCP57_10680 [Bacteroidota bacterium]